MLRKLVDFYLFLILAACASDKFDNDIDNIALTCGEHSMGHTYVSINSVNGSMIYRSQIASAFIDGKPLAGLTSTPRGCLKWPKQKEFQSIVIVHENKKEAVTFDSSDFDEPLPKKTSFEVNLLNSSLQEIDNWVSGFCPQQSKFANTLLDRLSPILGISGTSTKFIFLEVDSEGGRREIPVSDLGKTSLEKIFFDNNDLFKKSVVSEVISYRFRDLAGDSTKNFRCNVTINRETPFLKTINEASYYSNMHIDTSIAGTIELKFNSKIPPEKLIISYTSKDTAENITIDTLPVQTDEANEWLSLLRPPKLYGSWSVEAQFIDAASNKSRSYKFQFRTDALQRFDSAITKIERITPETIVVGTRSGNLALISTLDGGVLNQLNLKSSITSIHLLPKKNRLLVGAGRELHLIDLLNWKTLVSTMIDNDIREVKLNSLGNDFLILDQAIRVYRVKMHSSETFDEVESIQRGAVSINWITDEQYSYTTTLGELVVVGESGSKSRIKVCKNNQAMRSFFDFSLDRHLVVCNRTGIFSVSKGGNEILPLVISTESPLRDVFGDLDSPALVITEEKGRWHHYSLDSSVLSQPIATQIPFHDSYIGEVVVSGDGSLVLTGSEDKSFKIYDFKTSQSLLSRRFRSIVKTISYDEKQRHAFIGLLDGSVYLIQINEIVQKYNLDRPLYKFILGLENSDTYLAMSKERYSEDIYIESFSSEELHNNSFLLHSSSVNMATASEQEDIIIFSSSDDGFAKKVSFEDNQFSLIKERNFGKAVSRYYSYENRELVFYSKFAEVYDQDTLGDSVFNIENQNWIATAHLWVQGRYLSMGISNGYLRLVDLEKNLYLLDTKISDSNVTRHHLKKDQSELWFVTWNGEMGYIEKPLSSKPTSAKVEKLLKKPQGFSEGIMAEDRYYIGLNWDNTVYVSDTESKQSYRFSCFEDPLTTLWGLNTKNDLLAVVTTKGNVIIFNYITGQPVQRVRMNEEVTALAFSSDNESLIVGTISKEVFFVKFDPNSYVPCREWPW